MIFEIVKSGHYQTGVLNPDASSAPVWFIQRLMNGGLWGTVCAKDDGYYDSEFCRLVNEPDGRMR